MLQSIKENNDINTESRSSLYYEKSKEIRTSVYYLSSNLPTRYTQL